VPDADVPVIVTWTDACPGGTVIGLAPLGWAGPGATIFPIWTPQLSVAFAYSWIVHIVMSSQGSRLVFE